MNEQNRALQQQILREQIDIFGVNASWVKDDGDTENVMGLLSLSEEMVQASTRIRRSSPQVGVSQVRGFFVMETDRVPGEHGDRLIIDGEAFIVLPFKNASCHQAQTHIPLKPWSNKEHSWR